MFFEKYTGKINYWIKMWAYWYEHGDLNLATHYYRLVMDEMTQNSKATFIEV